MPIVTERTERRILGGAVMRLRKAYEITQAELATAAEVHFAYLSNIERGKKQPSVAVIVRIARRLAVDLDDISYLSTVYEIANETPAAEQVA